MTADERCLPTPLGGSGGLGQASPMLVLQVRLRRRRCPTVVRQQEVARSRVRGWRGIRESGGGLPIGRHSGSTGSPGPLSRSVSTPLLVEPGVRFSRTRLSVGIMPLPTERSLSLAQGVSGRGRPTVWHSGSARTTRISSCACDRATVAAAGSRDGRWCCRQVRPAPE